jgi:protocatechuate 3,4-dioxygenase beta subunit
VQRRRGIVVLAVAVAVLAGAAWAVVAARGPGPGSASEPGARPAAGAAGCRVTRGEPPGQAGGGAGGPSRTRLGPGAEVERSAATLAASRRGRPMVISGRVLASDCATPLAGATVTVWQTNGDGEYGPGANQSCCYLQGTMTTGTDGRYEFETVRPGHYKGEATPPPAHIHFEVRHPDGRGVVTELLFAGDPYLVPGAVGEVVRLDETAAGGGPLQVTFDVVLAGAAG